MFVVTKIVELILQPANFAILLFAAGAALSWTEWHGLGRAIVTVTAAICLTVLLFPVDQWLAYPLESKFMQPRPPAHVDGILILGGNLPNMVEGATAARRYPKATVVYTGGSVYLFGDDGGPQYAATTLSSLGVSRDRLVIEGKSRTTFENLQFSRNLLSPRKGQVWLLVTTAIQMRRALAVADHLHWPMVPWPSENISDRSGQSYWLFSFEKTSYSLGRVLHEYESLVAYRLEGKTDSMFP
ncbi:MAG TPA: YdcF family protein [Rhizomicrobium sp.]